MPGTGGDALLVVDMQNGFCVPAGSHPRIGLGWPGSSRPPSVLAQRSGTRASGAVRPAFMRDYRVTVWADALRRVTAELRDIGIRAMEACGFAAIARVRAMSGTKTGRIT